MAAYQSAVRRACNAIIDTEYWRGGVLQAGRIDIGFYNDPKDALLKVQAVAAQKSLHGQLVPCGLRWS
jgi:hypothetical protein